MQMPELTLTMQVIIVVLSIIVILSRIMNRRPRHKDWDEKLSRSNNYRKKYFDSNPGFRGKGIYICPYCGKILRNKKKIEIDHIQSVHSIRTNARLRRKYKKKDEGVNDLDNLTHSCRPCNRRKGSKGGIWVFLGHYGQYFMLPVRWTAFTLVGFLVVRIIIGF